MFVNISSKDSYQIKLERTTKFSEWSVGFTTFGSPDPRGVYSYSPPPKGREELKKEQEKRSKSEARKKNILKEENT